MTGRVSEPRFASGRSMSVASTVGVWGILAADIGALLLAPVVSLRVLAVVLACSLVAFAFVLPVPGVRACAGYAFAFIVCAQLRAVEDEAGFTVQFDYVAAVEKAVFLGSVPSRWLQEHLYDAGAVGALEIASAVVYLSYFVVPHVVALGLWRRSRAQFGRYALALFGTMYGSLVVAFFVPTAPPWLAAQEGHLPFIARIMKDLGNSADPGVYAQGYDVVGPNDVAAMPSLHMAMTALVAAAAWGGRPWVRILALAYACAMGFVLVYTGEHYATDIAAGCVLAVVAWRLSRLAFRGQAA
jgi:PAP2 superfamily